MPIEQDPLASKDAMAAFIQRARAAGKSDDEIRTFVKQKRAAYTPISEPPGPQLPPGIFGASKQQLNTALG